MPEQNGEKTQDATPHRRQKAHEEGSVARSQDLGSAVLLIVAIGGLMFSGEAVVRFLVQYARHQIGGDPWLETDLAASTAHLAGLFWALSEVLVPFFGLLLASAILVNLGQVGFLFLPSKVGFDLTRLDPLAGMGRIISVSNAVRLVLGIFKIGVILVVAALCVYGDLPAILALHGKTVPEIAVYLAHVLLWTALKIAIALLFWRFSIMATSGGGTSRI